MAASFLFEAFVKILKPRIRQVENYRNIIQTEERKGTTHLVPSLVFL